MNPRIRCRRGCLRRFTGRVENKLLVDITILRQSMRFEAKDRVRGSRNIAWTFPCRIFASVGLTPAALTRIRT
jgi:hypothetical protein